MKWADHVGLHFKAFGDNYKCVEYDPRKGLLMELQDESGFLSRKRGDTTWVSERAIGRTYHQRFEVGLPPAFRLPQSSNRRADAIAATKAKAQVPAHGTDK